MVFARKRGRRGNAPVPRPSPFFLLSKSEKEKTARDYKKALAFLPKISFD